MRVVCRRRGVMIFGLAAAAARRYAEADLALAWVELPPAVFVRV
jgi:hypothetical protein